MERFDKMKKYLALALALVMMLAISLPAFAAKSPDKPIEDVIDKVADKDGNDVTDKVEFVVNEESKAAEAELTDDKIEALLADDYKDDLVLGDVYDVIYSGDGYPITVTANQNVAKGDAAFVITKVGGEWVVLEDAVVEDGKVTFALDEDSVIAFVYERIPEEDSPITGNNAVIVAMIAVVCLAGTVYSVKRTVA